MGYNIGPKIGIDGEREFRQSIKKINDEYKALEAETRAVTAAFDANGDEQGKLEAQSKQLEKQIDKHMELYAEELIDMERLKAKLTALRAEIGEIEERLHALVSEERKQRDTRQEIKKYIKEIEEVMSLKSIGNVDLRKILSGISVNERREVTIHLHDFSEQ